MEKRAIRNAGTNHPEVVLMPELSPLEVHQAAREALGQLDPDLVVLPCALYLYEGRALRRDAQRFAVHR